MPDSSSKKLLKVEFQPLGRRTEIEPGRTLIEAAQSAGVDLVSVCGGYGSCDSCRVKLVNGKLNEPTSTERDIFVSKDIENGYRLACQAIPVSDVKIVVPHDSLTTPQRLQIEGQGVPIELDPIVTPIDISLEHPLDDVPLEDNIRLVETLKAAGESSPSIDPILKIDLTDRLRDQGWQARIALRRGEVVAILPPKERLFGLAVDLGTTKVAAYLVDLENGETVTKTGVMNPQIAFGEDVVSRIVHAKKGPEQRAALQQSIIQTINEIIASLCTDVSAMPEQVVELVVVGNTAMHHLLLGLPTRQLGVLPFAPAVRESMETRSSELGIHAALGAIVYFPPNIAGYVGGDHAALILATGIAETYKTVLALDIGTNTEVSLVTGGKLFSCSCASGPAFEGAHIQDGMRAASGAIERVQIIDEEIHIQTIGGGQSSGICGSGILDAVWVMVSVSALEVSGRLIKTNPSVRRTADGTYEYVLVPGERTEHGRDIVVTQNDVREFQLAKAAIQAGIKILLEEAHIGPEELDEFIIAGAFGTYIHVENAIHTKLFPDLPLNRFSQIGNGAGEGAKQLLISAQARQLIDELHNQISYINLASHPRFKDEMLEALRF